MTQLQVVSYSRYALFDTKRMKTGCYCEQRNSKGMGMALCIGVRSTEKEKSASSLTILNTVHKERYFLLLQSDGSQKKTCLHCNGTCLSIIPTSYQIEGTQLEREQVG